jgi:DNA-binding transcriptional regulator YhcF (GntR family)
MDPISNSIADLESREPGAQPSYRVCAEKWGVSRETLRRRHQGLQDTRAGASQQQQNLNLQQEKELVQYIKEITKQGLPPTRTMIQNFASAVATCRVSTRWVSRFIARHKAELTSK